LQFLLLGGLPLVDDSGVAEHIDAQVPTFHIDA
jgi:hypothetical protein